MEISEKVLKFLNREDVQSALIKNNLKQLYKLAENLYLSDPDIGELTNILIQAGIDPLLGMTEIPTCFLYYQEGIKSFSIPVGIIKIGRGAFAYTDLESITIPNSVKVIEEFAFASCENLKTVELPAGVELHRGAFSHSGLESIELKDVKLRDIIIFDSCKQLKSVIIKGDTPVIPDWTFYDCTNLTHVELPANLKKIENSILSGCSSLEEIDFAGTVEQWREIEVDGDNRKLFSCKIICSDGILRYDKTIEEWK